MDDLNNEAFISLFKDCYKKCFGTALNAFLSETESKHFSNKILEDTGLVIGAKSIKNYSFYVVNSAEAKQENPSVATLDTLARYVLNAPYTDEIQRKAKEGHFPYWFRYKSLFTLKKKNIGKLKKDKGWKKKEIAFFIISFFITALILSIQVFKTKNYERVVSNFSTVSEDSLKSEGWFIKSKDIFWWNKRNEKPSHLTLFTLRGDNWPDSSNAPIIKNLLLHKISSECFTAEIHLDSFIPRQNWEQAGILLLEDTTWTGKSVRLSVAYNDFFGGYNRPKEIIIQAITSGGNDFSKPEEIAHLFVFSLAPGEENLVSNNLKKSALKIEKNGNHFRFLYSTGPIENYAFKEVSNRDLLVKPKYIGLFALQGFVNDTNYIPAYFKFFSLINLPCEK